MVWYSLFCDRVGLSGLDYSMYSMKSHLTFPRSPKNSINMSIVQFRVVHVIVVQLLSHVQLFATP